VAFEAGSPEAPKSSVALGAGPGGGEGPEARASRGLWASPLFWAVAGAVLVSGGAGVFLATRDGGRDGPGSGRLVPALTCGQAACP
jgi:hypothetical protein